ncbi:MAG: hypothetical protein GY930_03825 [bacterium]|nr:hypothetical protein [bacterium]
MSSTPSKIQQVNELVVLRASRELGLLRRTKVGASFIYRPAHAEAHLADPAQAVCFGMPVR